MGHATWIFNANDNSLKTTNLNIRPRAYTGYSKTKIVEGNIVIFSGACETFRKIQGLALKTGDPSNCNTRQLKRLAKVTVGDLVIVFDNAKDLQKLQAAMKDTKKAKRKPKRQPKKKR